MRGRKGRRREINFPREEFFDFIRTLKKESVGKDLFQIRADVAFAAQAVLEKSTFLLMEELNQVQKTVLFRRSCPQ